jgi:biopolymer transport protein ExbD
VSLIYRRGPAQISANLTPMIDVTFLLIVFFVLVSQIVEVENVR